MPRCAKSSRALATTSSSRSRPMAAKTGVVWAQLAAGLVLRATTQIEQDVAAVLLG